MLFLQRWKSHQFVFQIKCYSETAIKIGLTRLTAIQLELEEQKSQIRSLPEFCLTESTSAEIRRFLETVYRQLPPPRDQLASSDVVKDTPASAVRGLVQVELALKFELRFLKAKRNTVLTPFTMQSVHDAIIHLERIQSSYDPINRNIPADLKAIRKQSQIKKEQNSQKLNFMIEAVFSEAKKEIEGIPLNQNSGPRQKHNILRELIKEYQNVYSSHRSELDLQLVLVLLDRLITIAEISGSLSTLVYSHGLFVSRLMKHVFKLLPQADPNGLNAFFWNMGRFGPKIRPLGTLRLEIDEMLGLACKKAESFMKDLIPSQITVSLRAMSILNFNGCHEFLDLLFKRMKTDFESFKQRHLIVIIRLCGTFYLSKQMEFFHVLSAIDLKGLHPSAAEDLMWAIPRLPAESGLAFDSNVRRYLNELISQFDHFMDTGVTFNASKVLWLLADMSCFPGENFLNRLVKEVLGQIQNSNDDIGSISRALASLQYFPDDFLKEFLDRWKRSYQAYPLQETCSFIFSLSLLGKTKQEHLELLRMKLQETNLNEVNVKTLTRLAQIHIQCEKVLDLVSPLDDKWKDLALKSRTQSMKLEKPVSIPEDITDFLTKLGYKIKDSVSLHDVLINIKSIEKDGQEYAIDIINSRFRVYGQKAVLRTTLLNRDQILKALNISLVRIDPEFWKMLESDQDKLDYINEIFTPDNQTPKLFPKSIEHSLFTSWIDPTKDSTQSSNDSRDLNDEQLADEDGCS